MACGLGRRGRRAAGGGACGILREFRSDTVERRDFIYEGKHASVFVFRGDSYSDSRASCPSHGRRLLVRHRSDAAAPRRRASSLHGSCARRPMGHLVTLVVCPAHEHERRTSRTHMPDPAEPCTPVGHALDTRGTQGRGSLSTRYPAPFTKTPHRRPYREEQSMRFHPLPLSPPSPPPSPPARAIYGTWCSQMERESARFSSTSRLGRTAVILLAVTIEPP